MLNGAVAKVDLPPVIELLSTLSGGKPTFRTEHSNPQSAIRTPNSFQFLCEITTRWIVGGSSWNSLLPKPAALIILSSSAKV